jgi:SAM-dependent methyltransferase
MKRQCESNRKAWNAAAGFHQKAMAEEWLEGFTQKGYVTFDDNEKTVYAKIDFTGKSVVQLPCNNGREILSFLNMGATFGLGIDISDDNIDFANKLKDVSGLNAEFLRENVYELPNTFDDRFDVAIISVGSFNWMSDLSLYLQIIKRLLKQAGELLIYEMHPLTGAFPYTFDEKKALEFEDSYFTKETYVSNEGLDYYGQTEYEGPTTYEYQHTMSSIIQTLIDLGFSIVEFCEYPWDIAGGHAYLEKDKRIPLSYSLKAVKG